MYPLRYLLIYSALLLAGCAEMMTRDTDPEPQPVMREVFFATTRAPDPENDRRRVFGTERGTLQYGSIPVELEPELQFSATPGMLDKAAFMASLSMEKMAPKWPKTLVARRPRQRRARMSKMMMRLSG